MNSRLAALGYAELEPLSWGAWMSEAGPIRGHEFRYSGIDPVPEGIARAFKVRKRLGLSLRTDSFLKT